MDARPGQTGTVVCQHLVEGHAGQRDNDRPATSWVVGRSQRGKRMLRCENTKPPLA